MEQKQKEERKKIQRKFKELNKSEYDYICEECMLNELEAKILKMRIQEKSIVEMALENNISTSKVSLIIKKIKKKMLKMF